MCESIIFFFYLAFIRCCFGSASLVQNLHLNPSPTSSTHIPPVLIYLNYVVPSSFWSPSPYPHAFIKLLLQPPTYLFSSHASGYCLSSYQLSRNAYAISYRLIFYSIFSLVINYYLLTHYHLCYICLLQYLSVC